MTVAREEEEKKRKKEVAVEVAAVVIEEEIAQHEEDSRWAAEQEQYRESKMEWQDKDLVKITLKWSNGKTAVMMKFL